jgi:hypothetical protein
MVNLQINTYKTYRFSLLIIFLGLSLLNYSCSKSERIPVELENQLRAGGVQDINLDFTYQSPDVPDKKYMAITVTYNFSTADGTLQKEYRGFILKLENGSWKTDHNTSYTKNTEKAKSLLEGKK